MSEHLSSEALVAAHTRFAFRLFAEVAGPNVSKNVFISPYSVSLALTMTCNGASGATQAAMAEALQIAGAPPDWINRLNGELREVLEKPDPLLQLAIANALWLREGVVFAPAFIETNRQYYDAEVVALNFADPDAPGVINGWVNEKTHGKISRIVDFIPPVTVLILANAIYFKGAWGSRFDEGLTKERPFTLLDGRSKQHPLMSQSGEYPYLRGEGFQAVQLPYQSAGAMSMVIFLPDEDSSLAALLGNLAAENWARWMASFRETEGDIMLPRFKLEYEVRLNGALNALGMGIAFDPSRADFSALCAPPERVWIDTVIHKTFVEVNEEGTEAAAVTAVVMRGLMAAPPRRFRMVVDRPFFFAIVDHTTGTVLFMGVVVDPE